MCRMLVTDYLLDAAEFDWASLLSDWDWLLPEGEFTVWLMNRYGDLFLVLEDGGVRMLDVGNGSVEKLAESREDFMRKIDEGGNADDWLMIPLVDGLREGGRALGPGRCYSRSEERRV